MPTPVGSIEEATTRLFGRGLIYTVALAVQVGAAFLVVPIVTRTLSASGYGQVAAGLVVFTIVSMVGAAGLSEAASRTFFDGPDGPRQAHLLVAAVVGFAAATALLATLTGPFWAPLFSLPYTGVLPLAVWGGAAGAVMYATQSLLRAADRVWAFLAVAIIASVATQGLGVALLLAGATPARYMSGLAIGTAFAALAGVAITGSLRHGFAGPRLLGRGLRLGLPLIPHSVGIYLLSSADRVAIVAILGLASAGRYQIAYAAGSAGVLLVIALNQAWLPLLLGAPEERRWEILTATARSVHGLAVLVASALAVVAPVALLVAAPPSYGREELVPVVAVVAFSILPYATLCTYLNLIFITGRTGVMAIAAPVAAGVNVGLCIVLLPRIQLLGAALATVAAYVVLCAIAGIVARRRVPTPGLLRASLGAWALAAPAVVAGALLPPTAIGTTARIALGAILIAGATRLIRHVRAPSRRAGVVVLDSA